MLNELRFGQEFRQASRLWQQEEIQKLGDLRYPPGLRLNNEQLLEVDLHSLWWRWFLESFVPLETRIGTAYGHLYEQILSVVRTNFHRSPADEQNQMARLVADTLNDKTLALKAANELKRQPWSLKDKRSLLVAAGQPPRCYICGHQFLPEAIELFLERRKGSIPVPDYVDLMKLRAKSRDFKIEIEHVDPLSRGGRDRIENLRLACGWCNSVKHSHLSLYDAPADASRCLDTTMGPIRVPQPLWVLRLLVWRGRCEHLTGCSATTKSHELTIFPRGGGGHANPMNMGVTCDEHDPIKNWRLIPHSRL